jgi:iron complex outermembrane receptor protein
LYLTWSEGFRPGLLNRPGGAAGPNGYTVPFALRTDTVTNVELGWKLDLIDNTMRFNGSLFSVEIQDLQTTIFDTSIVNLFFSDNAANAEILGIEGDVVWNVSDRLTLAGAFSALDTQILKVITPTKDVRKGDNLAFAPSFQGNLRARYQWSSNNGSEMHVMPYVSYSSSSASDIITINSAELESWTLAGITAGMARNNWSAEVYVDNLLNEKAQLSSSFVYDRHRVSYARPMTVGVRLSLDLN